MLIDILSRSSNLLALFGRGSDAYWNCLTEDPMIIGIALNV